MCCCPNSIHSCKTELQSKSLKLIAVKSQALISMCFYHFHAVQIEYSCYLLFVTVNNSHLPSEKVKSFLHNQQGEKTDFKQLESFHKNNVHRAEGSLLLEQYNVVTTLPVILLSTYPLFKSSSYNTFCISEEPEMS